MIVYRLSKGMHRKDLSGKGAELCGGRWNSKGTAILYTSQSRALCTTEIAVHSPLGILPSDYWISSIEIPDTAPLLEIHAGKLPKDWKTFPYPHSTQLIGDKFIREGKYLVMKVPSAVVDGDHNFLLNPKHPMFKEVKIRSSKVFEFDERLFRRSL